MPPVQVHLLDVGKKEYGDCILCEIDNTTILIDGSHPGDEDGSPGHASIPDQLGTLLGREAPFRVSLLVVTHAHSDHIGCLPALVKSGTLQADHALVADPALGWGRKVSHVPRPLDATNRAVLLAAALREEVRTDFESPTEFEQFLAELMSVETDYHEMIDYLVNDGTLVVRFGRDDPAALLRTFRGIGLQIIGPSQDHLERCAEIIAQLAPALTEQAQALLDSEPALTLLDAYRNLTRGGGAGLNLFSTAAAVNLQSMLLSLNVGGRRFLFTGDMQFNKPEVGSPELKTSVQQLHETITRGAPYDLVKIAHHGSDDAFTGDILDDLGQATINFGICTGESSDSHPHPDVLKALEKETARITWVRTDRNRLSTYTFTASGVEVSPAVGAVNDASPNA